MPQTPTYGFEYETPQSKPGITLTGNSDGLTPILAEQVETALAGIDSRLAAAEGDIAVLDTASPSDTGWIALSATAGGGYSLTTNLYRRWGPLVSIIIHMERTGGAFPANSSGGITDTAICTINTTAARPDQLTQTLIRTTTTSGAVDVATNGVITIVDMHANSIISTNDFVRIAHTYFVSTFN
jgi:hypothetical protein